MNEGEYAICEGEGVRGGKTHMPLYVILAVLFSPCFLVIKKTNKVTLFEFDPKILLVF